jgi:hypothetical protein
MNGFHAQDNGSANSYPFLDETHFDKILIAKGEKADRDTA